jgi:signal transduction histidine kinase
LPLAPCALYDRAVITGGRIIIVAALLAAGPAAARSLDDIAQWRAPILAIVAAAWAALGVWAVIRGAHARLQAKVAREWGLRLRGLLATMPGAYLVVGDDGSATSSDNLRAWLGLGARVTKLDDLAPRLGSGFEAAAFDQLRRSVEAMRISGEAFNGTLATANGRVLAARCAAAPPEVVGPRGVVVWLRDATEEQAASAALQARAQSLGASLASNAALVEAAPFPVWLRGPDLALAHVNQAYVEAVRAASPAEAVAAGIELAANSLSAAPDAAARRAQATGVAQVREEPVIIGEERRLLRITEVPLGGSGVGGYAIDVTERDEARHGRERLMRAQTDTLDRLSAGVALFGGDRSLSFHNKAFAALFQLDAAWLDDRPEFDRVIERMYDMRRLPEQRDFPSWRRARTAWFTDLVEAREETWALPDSSVIRVVAQPYPDGGLLLVFEDRSEQLRLASSRDTLLRVQQATLDNLHEGVAVFGADGRLQLANARFAEIWSLDRGLLSTKPHIDDLMPRTAMRLADPLRGEVVRDIIRTTTAGDRRESRQGRLGLRDGRLLDFAAVPLPDGNVLFTYLDITDSQRIEQALRDRNDALEAADKLKSAFVANISYELRTPLTAISGFGEMLAAGYAGAMNERQTEYVGSILTSSDRLQLLINDILDLAITEAGELELDIGDVAVEPLIRSVADMAGQDASARSLALSVEVAPEVGMIEGDERRLKQVLYNLLVNAVRFTPAGGRIGLNASGDRGGVTLVVSDSGIGIPDAEQSAVFARFRKGSNAGPQGVGLGLALVREFVELHNGHVELASHIGEGTVVTIHLPRHQPIVHPAVAE